MKTDNPTVSIIIPVYNCQDYLSETLEAVKKQTYSNLEILLVDDGSTDSSGLICDSYADSDPRFRAFHLKNGGVAAARNFALTKITGEYCMFIDSDDLVNACYVEVMLAAALAENAAIVTCNCVLGYKKPKKYFEDYRPSTEPPHYNIRLSDYRYTSRFQHDVVWGGLYRSDLVKDVRFDTDLYVGEDTLFFARLLKQGGALTYLDDAYYYYTYRPTSLANRKYHARQATEITSWERVCELFSDMPEPFQNECKAALAWRCKKNYERAVVYHFSDRALMETIYRKALKLRKNVFHSPEVKKIKKINYFCFLIAPRLFSWLREIITGV